MFGFIVPHKPELKIKEFEIYRGYYCGMCKELSRNYGIFSRLLLNYDLVFLALLGDALQQQKANMRQQGCIVNPVAKHATAQSTGGLAFGADTLMLLSYHKLQDNLQDEAPLKRLACFFAKPYLYFKYKKAKARQPEIESCLAQQMQQQALLEKAACTSTDMACEPTAQMCSALFQALGQNPQQKLLLGRMGLFAGQIIYLLDAAEDFEKDKKSKNYNVFVAQGLLKQQAEEAAKVRCNMAAGEMAACYNLLNLKTNQAIINNILFLGIPAAISAAGAKQNGRKKPKHGQINGI